MTQNINTIATINGKNYLIVGVHARWDMYIAREVGRHFQTLIGFGEVHGEESEF